MAAIDQDPDDVITYPGKMITYPGFTRGQPTLHVHDCVQVDPYLIFRFQLIRICWLSAGLSGLSTQARSIWLHSSGTRNRTTSCCTPTSGWLCPTSGPAYFPRIRSHGSSPTYNRARWGAHFLPSPFPNTPRRNLSELQTCCAQEADQIQQEVDASSD